MAARVLPVAVPIPEGGGREQRPDAGSELRQQVDGEGLAEDISASKQALGPGGRAGASSVSRRRGAGGREENATSKHVPGLGGGSARAGSVDWVGQ